MKETFDVMLPKLGESIVNATIVKWFKEEGQSVEKDEPLLEVSTDKVNSEIPSPISGIVKKIYARPDQELNVGDLLATLEVSSHRSGAAKAVVDKEEDTLRFSSQEEGGGQMQEYYSPALLRLAQESGLSLDKLSQIRGTGTGGRVCKKDLEDHLKKVKLEQARQEKKNCPAIGPMGSVEEGVEHIKMTRLRKAIAENMVRSFYEAPHASLVCQVDLTGIMELIVREKEAFFEKHGVKLTITSFVIRAMARALKEYPLLNASLQGDTIVVKRFINIGIAVSVEQGVVVPVIKRCHARHLEEIAESVSEYAHKARTNGLNAEDLEEGTITMTNFGMTGIEIGIPIIRHPEVAIVGLGGITKQVVVLPGDLIAIRQMAHLCLTFDHRVLDGMYGCGFLNALKAHLEQDLSL